MSETRKINVDHDLVAAARQGDEAAFGQLVERYKDSVFATVVAITRDFDEAKDISQEVFLRAWFGLGGLKETAAWPGWLRTIARNRARTWIERRRRQPVREPLHADLADPSDSPERAVERADRKRLVTSALGKLPENSSEALLLYYVDEIRTPQMAMQLGITEAAVRQRLRRARQQMLQTVEDEMAETIREEAPGPEFTQEVTELIGRSRSLFQQVHYREAAPMLERAREQTQSHPLVAMLLADAYVFARSREDLEADRGAYERAVALLDEVVEQEPQNMLALLRRASIRALLAPPEESLAEQQQLAERARGETFEVIAELELARRHLGCGRAREALAIYRELTEACAELSCVVQSEMGVAHAMAEDGAKAIACFERAVDLTTVDAMVSLKDLSERLIGEAYWSFWATVDNLPARQCQNHAWLAGLNAARGEMDAAREHLRTSLAFMRDEAIGPAASVLKRQFVGQMDRMFPQLASEPELKALRQEVEAA